MSRTIISILVISLTACAAPLTPTTTATPAPPTPTTAAIEMETYNVYTVVLSKWVEDEETVIVLVSDSYSDDLGLDNVVPVNSIRRSVSGVEESTLANFAEVRGISVPLSDHFGPDLNVEIITNEELSAIFTGDVDLLMSPFYEVYPTAPGLHRISQVGFNAQMTQALVEQYVQFNRRACTGEYLLLEKKRDQWQLITSHTHIYC